MWMDRQKGQNKHVNTLKNATHGQLESAHVLSQCFVLRGQ